MELLATIIEHANDILSPFLVIGLLGTGAFLTLKLGLIQVRRLGHGFAVTSGKYDDPNEPGDVTHFQALTTALSATVGIGNIAGVAIAIHWGGPGALFWMWMTALLGMATKFSEVTLAQHYRVKMDDAHAWEGSVAGGPMYYIEKGIKEVFGWNWKPVAIFFAFMLLITSFFTGNAIQANTIATQVASNFGIATWMTGVFTARVVGTVIIGGIRRIGAVTSILAPVMAALYVLGALVILVVNAGDILPAFATIFSEAFNPTAGVAGMGIGVFLVTMRYGVQRGLFSNEAGQGSAPIAHSAAKTDEPVSEGVVALLEPFIDTIVICTMTGLVIVATHSYDARIPTELALTDGNISYVTVGANGGQESATRPSTFRIVDGYPVLSASTDARMAYYDVAVDRFFTDESQTITFSGTIFPADERAEMSSGSEILILYGNAARNSSGVIMATDVQTTCGVKRLFSPIKWYF
jgi:AGCS family alanine or glycine:cation symporter